jgi:hypothetical protein
MKKQFFSVILICIVLIAGTSWNAKAQYWKLTGNSGTNPSTNFLGTTDDKALKFKVNNILSGEIDNAKFNAFFGYKAGLKNSGSKTVANYNTYMGQDAGLSNILGSYNTAIGYAALFNNTGSDNTSIGYHSLFNNTQGDDNTAVGFGSLFANTSANFNTAVGYQAGDINTTGSNNTYVGFHAGNTVTTGSSNTIIGYGADVNNGTFSNATAIGNLAVVGASNHVHIGNSSVTVIGGQVGWSKFSDERIKNNIRQNVPGLAFINLLTPVTYHIDLNKQQSILGEKDSSNYEGKNDIEKIQYTGFVAQDVEAAAKKIGYDFSGVNVPGSDKDLYSLCYGDFVVPLVKAVQELSKMNDAKDSSINDLQQKYNAQQKEIDELKAMIVSSRSTVSSEQSGGVSTASLQQNVPNPFFNSTIINYSIPKQFSSANIIITDRNGKALKQFDLSNNNGSVNMNASTLLNGTYQYSLYVDGKLIVSKQMIVSK